MVCQKQTVSTLMDINIQLNNDQLSKKIGPVYHQSMLTTSTSPDIAHAIGTYSKFNFDPTEAHQTAVKHIFHYLQGAFALKLQYKPASKTKLQGYSDAD